MSVIDTRLRANYPTAQITIISLIVALAYENLIQAMGSDSDAWTMTPRSFFVWCQCLFMINAPAMAWLKLTLDGSTLRLAYSPFDGLMALLAGIAFIVLASAIGVAHAEVWMTAAALIHLNAWGYWRYQDRRYARDPDAAPAAGAHRHGTRLLLLSGLGIAVATGLFHYSLLGLVAAGLTLIVAAILMDCGHYLWYRDWKRVLLTEG